MGNLKPIGSEKLQGIDKIRRMIEISTYKLNTPKSINEDSSNEFKRILADGVTYHIVKEKNGYVIKSGLNESTAEYIEPIKNRKFYPSYSQALKRLNLITKEINVNEGQRRNISLFNESEDVVEYVLDLEEQDVPATPPPAAPPVPQSETPAPPPPPVPAPEGDDMPEMDDETPIPEPEEPMDDEEESDEEGVTFKTIQKTTGKLAQKIRAFLGDEENEMSSEDTKYVINSVLSALDLSTLDDEDMEEIMVKFEGSEEGESEVPDMGEEDPNMEDMGMEETPPPAPEGTTPPPPPPAGEVTEYGIHGAREKRHIQKVKDMFEEVFSESKVDKVLSRYFNNGQKKSSEQNRNKILGKIQNLSESFSQEKKSLNFYNNYRNSKFLGKNQYGYLVFEMDDRKIRITPNGQIL
jgi:hypothetical protein